MNKQEIINKRIIKPEYFFGKRYTASDFIKSGFEKLFSLFYKNFGEDFIIESAIFEINKLNITIRNKQNKQIIEFSLSQDELDQNRNGKNGLGQINLGINNNGLNENFSELIRFLRIGLKKINFIDILNILAKDPKAKKEFYQLFWKSKRPTDSIIQDRGKPIHKIRFMVPEGLIRNADQGLNFNFPTIDLHHSERECKGIYPYMQASKEIHFFNFPSGHYDHTFDKYFYLNDEEKNDLNNKKGLIWITLFTDLNENDIISGKGNEKLENEINNGIKQIDEYGIKMIKFNCCCVPRITGDDVYSILKKAKNKIKIPFLFSGQIEKTPYEQNIILLEEYLSKIDKNKQQIIKNSIILFGYHEDIYLKYLNDIFSNNRIKLNAIFLPNIDVMLIEKLFQTELFIFSPNKLQEEIFEYPFKNFGIEYIVPKQPYGIINTTNWFEQIFEKLGKKYVINQDNKILIDEFQERKEYVISKNYSIGLIFTSQEEIELFFDIDYTNNVDIIEMLEEMGFEINFFVLKKGNNKLIEDLINKKTSKANIVFFESEKGMYNSIKESGISLIYTDIFFDDRIYKISLNQINIKYFNSGYIGALDSINSIIKAIEINYFNNFGKYIK